MEEIKKTGVLIQKGGTILQTARCKEASRMGVAACEALLDDLKSIMIGMVNNEMVHVPLNKTGKLHKDIDHKLLGLTQVLI